MLLKDFTSGAIPSSMCKVMCDLTMYELNKEVRTEDLRKVKDLLANTFLREFGEDIVGEYISKLPDEIQDKFRSIYDSFIITLELHGFNQVLISSSLLEDQVYRHFSKSRGIFGATLDNAVRKQIEYVANNFKVSEWKVDEHPNAFGLLNSAVTGWTDKSDYSTDKFFSNLQMNIGTDAEGKSFIADSRLTDDNDSSDLFNSELYVELMSSIYRGSAELFKLANSSTLKELLYSTVNLYQTQELDMLLESTPSNSIAIQVDSSSLIPYKSKKNTDFKEGHLPFVLKGYQHSGIGNESSCNATYARGIEILKSIDSLVNNIDLNDSVTFIVTSITKGWTQEIYGSIGQVGVSNIIAAVLDTRRLKDILSKNNYGLLQFPTIELRQNTWNRFSNFYELINFYRTHEKLDRNIIAPEFTSDERSSIYDPGISVSNIADSYSSTGAESIDNYIEENFGNIKLSSKTIIKSRNTKISYRASTYADKVEEAIWITLRDEIVTLGKCVDNLGSITNTVQFNMTMSFLECLIVPVLKFAGNELENYSLSEQAIIDLYKYGEDDKLSVDYVLQGKMLNTIISDPNIPQAFKDVVNKVRNGLLTSLNNPISYYSIINTFNDKLYGLQKDFLIKKDFYISDGSGVPVSSINYINLMNYRLSKYLLNIVVELLMDICDTNNIFSVGAEDLAESVFNNMFKSLTDVILRTVSRHHIKSIASGNVSSIIDDFTKWYSDTYKLNLTSMARFREFKHFELHPSNIETINLVSKIVKLLIDYSDKFLYSSLNKSVKSANSLSVWDSIKEYLNSSFLQASINHLDDEIQQHSMSYRDDTFCLRGCPTVAGTTIIADPRNLKRPYIRETTGSSYWVYSNLGFKALVPSNIDVPVKLSEDERNELILAVGGLFSS